jgi:hypothetical protein
MSPESACGRKEVDLPLSRFPLRGQAGAGGFPQRRKMRASPPQEGLPPPCESPALMLFPSRMQTRPCRNRHGKVKLWLVLNTFSLAGFQATAEAATARLPVIPYDYRDSSEALVHKNLRLPFDGNRYCVPHRYVGRRLTIKADSSSVTIYDRFQEVVSCARAWRRGQTFGAAHFEKLLAEQRPAARRSQAQQRLLDSLDNLFSRSVLEAYLRDMADTDRSLGRQISELLELIRQYGPQDVAVAIEKASAARAFGADYVTNILCQQRSPRRPQPPLRLRDPLLNQLVTDPLSLLGYDAFIL